MPCGSGLIRALTRHRRVPVASSRIGLSQDRGAPSVPSAPTKRQRLPARSETLSATRLTAPRRPRQPRSVAVPRRLTSVRVTLLPVRAMTARGAIVSTHGRATGAGALRPRPPLPLVPVVSFVGAVGLGAPAGVVEPEEGAFGAPGVVLVVVVVVVVVPPAPVEVPPPPDPPPPPAPPDVSSCVASARAQSWLTVPEGVPCAGPTFGAARVAKTLT